MKIYNIVGGAHGAGKSSLIGSFKYQHDKLGVIIDVGRITAELYEGDEHESGKAIAAKIDRCIADGVNFTQESTLAGSHVRKVTREAKQAGCYIRLFYVGIDTVEEALKRIRNRVDILSTSQKKIHITYYSNCIILTYLSQYFTSYNYFDTQKTPPKH